MVRKAERTALVRTLRDLARKVGVARVPDGANRQRVTAMKDGILAAAALTEEDRGIVNTTFRSYEETFPAHAEAAHQAVLEALFASQSQPSELAPEGEVPAPGVELFRYAAGVPATHGRLDRERS